MANLKPNIVVVSAFDIIINTNHQCYKILKSLWKFDRLVNYEIEIWMLNTMYQNALLSFVRNITCHSYVVKIFYWLHSLCIIILFLRIVGIFCLYLVLEFAR